MKVFESRLPQGLYYKTIAKKVVTMDHARKHVKVGAVKVFDTNLVYSRVIVLQASGRDIDIKDVLGHEAKSKCTLTTTLQVEVSDLFKSATLFNIVLIVFIYIPIHIFLHFVGKH